MMGCAEIFGFFSIFHKASVEVKEDSLRGGVFRVFAYFPNLLASNIRNTHICSLYYQTNKLHYLILSPLHWLFEDQSYLLTKLFIETVVYPPPYLKARSSEAKRVSNISVNAAFVICMHNSFWILQGEYEKQESIGVLNCGHEYHIDCIKKWLLVKNICPICKSSAFALPEKEDSWEKKKKWKIIFKNSSFCSSSN